MVHNKLLKEFLILLLNSLWEKYVLLQEYRKMLSVIKTSSALCQFFVYDEKLYY